MFVDVTTRSARIARPSASTTEPSSSAPAPRAATAATPTAMVAVVMPTRRGWSRMPVAAKRPLAPATRTMRAGRGGRSVVRAATPPPRSSPRRAPSRRAAGRRLGGHWSTIAVTAAAASAAGARHPGARAAPQASLPRPRVVMAMPVRTARAAGNQAASIVTPMPRVTATTTDAGLGTSRTSGAIRLKLSAVAVATTGRRSSAGT